MAFEKVREILRLATMAIGRSGGIAIQDVTAAFQVSHRTAQRMLHVLEEEFPGTETSLDFDGRKRWRLPAGGLRDFLTVEASELTALDVAISALRKNHREAEAVDLAALRDKVAALLPRKLAIRIEPDHEVLLEAQGFACRPGPRPRSDPYTATAIARALTASLVLRILYRSQKDGPARWREVVPLGVLSGLRRYLVARPMNDDSGPARLYRTEAIAKAEVTGHSFARDTSFDLRTFAERAFGAFQNDEEYGEVVWRFSPEAASRARDFQFHPSQTMSDQPDGSLIVCFHAAGHLEMCWYLYSWGASVEVLAPERLRRMVYGHRRHDFPSLP